MLPMITNENEHTQIHFLKLIKIFYHSEMLLNLFEGNFTLAKK